MPPVSHDYRGRLVYLILSIYPHTSLYIGTDSRVVLRSVSCCSVFPPPGQPDMAAREVACLPMMSISSYASANVESRALGWVLADGCRVVVVVVVGVVAVGVAVS